MATKRKRKRFRDPLRDEESLQNVKRAVPKTIATKLAGKLRIFEGSEERTKLAHWRPTVWFRQTVM